MQPLSPTTRRLYLALFMFLFAAVLPITIFYADGWRYSSGYGFVRTGGIYISVPYQGATVSLNDTVIGESGFLEHNFYKGDLAPSAYIVHVEKEGYRPWDRLLVVDEQLVTDAHAVLIPAEIQAQRLVVATSTPVNSTTTLSVSAATIAQYNAVFAATTTASSTLPVDEANGIGLFIVKGALAARWIQESAFPSSVFCERPSECVDEIMLDKGGVTRAYFYRGGVAYAMKDGTVYFKEIDARDHPITAELFSIKNADIRVIDDALIIKSGSALYEINL